MKSVALMSRGELEAEVLSLRREYKPVSSEIFRLALMGALKLTRLEARIVEYMYNAYPRAVSKGVLFDSLYTSAEIPEIKIIDVYICKIRAKIGKNAFTTVWAVGYGLTPEGKARIDSAMEAL